MKKKIPFLVVLVSTIIFSASFFHILNADTNEYCDGGNDCSPSGVTATPSATNSTISVSGNVEGGSSGTQFTQCSSGSGPMPPEPVMESGSSISYTVDGVSGNAPVNITQQMIQPGPNNNCAQQNEQGNYSFAIPNPSPGFPPFGTVNFIDGSVSFGSPAQDASLVSENIPSQLPLLNHTYGPYVFTVENTGQAAWVSDQSTTSKSGDCSTTDSSTGYSCPSTLGNTCTNTITHYSSTINLKNISQSSVPSGLPSLNLNPVSIKYAQNVVEKCTYTQIGSASCQGSCSQGSCSQSSCGVPQQQGGCGGTWNGNTNCSGPYPIYSESTTGGDPNVEPGATTTFTLNSVTTPSVTGLYDLVWQMVDGNFGNLMPVSITVGYTVTGAAGTGGTITPLSQSVNGGSTATFTVTPSNGYSISSVNDNCGAGGSGTNTYTTGSITKNCTVTASFSQIISSGTLSPASPSCTIASGASNCSVNLTWTTISPVGTSAVTSNGSTLASANNGSQPFTVSYPSQIFYLYNNSVLLAQSNATATCVSGTAWNGSTCASYTLTVNTAGTGSGTVGGSGTYAYNTTATATATANTGSTFSGWSAPCNSSGQVTMSGNETCTATFTLNNYTLTVNTAGTGSGTVTGSGTYAYGSTPAVTATANTGSTFNSWSNCAVSGGKVTILGNTTCTANFTLNNYTLTVNTAGTGSGTVTGSGTYAYNTNAPVTATANTGSTFAGWSNCTVSGGNVTITGNTTCTATFNLIPLPTVNVTANPQNIPYDGTSTISWTSTGATSCSSTGGGGSGTTGSFGTGALTTNTQYSVTCNNGVAGGNTTGSVIVAVGGAPSGTISTNNPSCTIAAGNSTCNLNFTWTTTNPIGTSAVTSPSFQGNVFSGNSGTNQSHAIPFGSSIYYLYNNGSLLAQTPAVTSSCATGTTWNNTTCATNTYTVSTSAGAGGSISPTSATVNYNANTSFTVTPNSNYSISSVSGCGGSGTSTYTTGAITSNCTVTATFSQNPMSGTLTPALPTCTIASNASSCNVTLTWTTTNPQGTSAVTANGMPNVNGNNGSQAFAVPYSSQTFYLYNNAVLLAQSNATSSCISGTTWSGSVCAPSGGGNGPDLTAGGVTPTLATAGTAVTLTATISNIGNASTGTSFPNFFQVATGPNGSGTISNLASTTMTTLAAGANNITTKAYTFASAGTYSARACANTSNNITFSVTESNYGNNCGVWTGMTVSSGCSAQQGNACVSSPNSCGQVDGTVQCNGSCLPPPNSSCPVCGDGNSVAEGVACDNGAANNGACPDTCSSSCTINSCSGSGNGVCSTTTYYGCTSGTSANHVSGTNNVTWTCGSTACSLPKPNYQEK